MFLFVFLSYFLCCFTTCICFMQRLKNSLNELFLFFDWWLKLCSFGYNLLWGYFLRVCLMHNGWIILFCAIWSYLIEFFLAIFTPIVVIVIDLVPKTYIRLCPIPLLSHILKRLVRIPILSANEICDDYWHWSWNTGVTMHQHIMLLFPFLIYPSDSFIEMLDDGVFEYVLYR